MHARLLRWVKAMKYCLVRAAKLAPTLRVLSWQQLSLGRKSPPAAAIAWVGRRPAVGSLQDIALVTRWQAGLVQ